MCNWKQIYKIVYNYVINTYIIEAAYGSLFCYNAGLKKRNRKGIEKKRIKNGG